jgi:hypothetical protein
VLPATRVILETRVTPARQARPVEASVASQMTGERAIQSSLAA